MDEFENVRVRGGREERRAGEVQRNEEGRSWEGPEGGGGERIHGWIDGERAGGKEAREWEE